MDCRLSAGTSRSLFTSGDSKVWSGGKRRGVGHTPSRPFSPVVAPPIRQADVDVLSAPLPQAPFPYRSRQKTWPARAWRNRHRHPHATSFALLQEPSANTPSPSPAPPVEPANDHTCHWQRLYGDPSALLQKRQGTPTGVPANPTRLPVTQGCRLLRR